MQLSLLDSNPYEAFSFREFWEIQRSTFVSFYFIFFVLALVALYYLLPRKFRWTVLLAGSAAFYATAGFTPFLTIALSAAVTWGAALMIEDTDKEARPRRKMFLFSSVAALLFALIFGKLYNLYAWNIPYVIPLGISYYTFSAISYLADVYWGKDRAERNFFKLALFLLWFPKILEGPISRHKNVASQLTRGNRFDYEGFCFGVQLAMWGYFKKMVIADRLALFTGTVLEAPDSYGGMILLLTMFLYAIEWYCDFSACADIACGISEMFGIRLEKNFQRPFFSRSAAEFWRRWHITLGTWFKDYIYMPLAVSPQLIRLSGRIGKRFGRRPAKAFIILIPTFVTWILTGLWHGTGANFVAWGAYWATLISLSTIFAPEFRKLGALLRIDEKSASWRRVQVARTFILFCLGRLLSIPETLSESWSLFVSCFTNFRPWELTDGTLFQQGLIEPEFILSLLMIALLWYVETQQEKGVEIRRRIAAWPLVIRCAFYAFSLLFILIFGIYGPGYNAGNFAYVVY